LSRCNSIKEELKQYIYRQEELKQLENSIKELRDKMTSIASTQFDAIPYNGTGEHDKIGELITKVVDLEQKYNDKFKRLLSEQERLEIMLDGLDERERVLMRKRYKESKNWETICVEMHYSWNHIHRLHSRCLTKLQNKE